MPDATSPAPAAGPLAPLLERAEALAYDLELRAVAAWKAGDPARRAVGYLPTFVPREVLWAAGVLPVAIYGGGDRVETIRGDAFYQSYICHFPRSVLELAISGRLDALDGMLFPSTCDVIRNLSGIWQLQFPTRYVRYFDYPQVDDPAIRRDAYRAECAHLQADMERLTGRHVTDGDLRAAIADYDANRAAVAALFAARRIDPARHPASEAYVLLRAGAVLPPPAHTAMLREYLALAAGVERPALDNSRVVVRGGFCEQPPLGLIRTLERAGCDLVEDDFLLGARWLEANIGDATDPLDALAAAYATHGAATASHYTPERAKGAALVAAAREARAEGVVFCAPSFCDPALLDQPMLAAACDAAGLPHTQFKYSEDGGQFQVIREQAGTFADSIRLWGSA